jgi:hypothetical protein
LLTTPFLALPIAWLSSLDPAPALAATPSAGGERRMRELGMSLDQ